MTTPPVPRDLTRWNRAGLARFRYVDANAVELLEFLRAELANPSRFPATAWGVPRPDGEQTPAGHLDRVHRQYESPSQDWAWEIGRSLARAVHVLGEHLDAYANEGYLRTATQWDAVRMLVAVLDVRPAPPASALASLVIDGKGVRHRRCSADHRLRSVPTMQACGDMAVSVAVGEPDVSR